MNKSYYRIVWENYPSDKTPLNEQNLNKIDVALDEMDNRIISLDSTKFDKSEAQLLVKYIEYDEDTGIFKITHYNGASYTIDTLLEKLAINFDYDYQTQRLIIELSDGTIKYVDLSALITQYEFLDSDTMYFTISADGKVMAGIKEGSVQEKHLQPNYLADIKVEVSKAEASATAADASEKAAKASENAAKVSQIAAKVSEDNASDSASDAAASEATATQKAADAAASATTATQKATAAGNSASAAATSASTATDKANVASTSATAAAASATSADTYAKQAQSYAVGTGGVRPSESSDNAKYYYEQSKDIYDNFSSAGNVTGVKGDSETSYRTGNVNIAKSNIGLGNVDNTSDLNKPISTAQQAEFNKKLATDGDGSNLTETFEQASSRANIVSGDTHVKIFGKIRKWFADMTAAAFMQVITSNTDLMATTVAGYLVDALAVKQQFDVVNSKLLDKANSVSGYSPYIFGSSVTFSNGVGTYILQSNYDYLNLCMAQLNANTGYYIRATTINASTKTLTLYAYNDAGGGLSATLGVNILVFRK